MVASSNAAGCPVVIEMMPDGKKIKKVRARLAGSGLDSISRQPAESSRRLDREMPLEDSENETKGNETRKTAKG